jgi:exonuclease SbcD
MENRKNKTSEEKMKQITFIHAADLHLDSPMTGLKTLPHPIFNRLKESTFASFSKIVDAAIHHRVDFVILAGDLFDGEDRSIRAQTRFRKEMERLARYGIPVYIVHGNHDHLGGKWLNIPFPENVFVFPGEVKMHTFKKNDGTTVSLYGFSYPERNVLEKRVDEYEKQGEADFHIGILHGNLEGSSEHDRYAPFTVNDLLDKQFDYWALGHIHKRMQLYADPPIVYPGNIQGRHRKETGEKGCYLVSLSESAHELAFIPTSDVIWDEVEVDASDAATLADLHQLCAKAMDDLRKDDIGVIVTIKLKGVALPDQEKVLFDREELLLALQDEERDGESSFVWPVDLLIEEVEVFTRDTLSFEADFFQELFKTIDTYENWEECLAPLYRSSQARKYLTPLSRAEKEQMVQEAEKMLIQLLKK